MPIRSGDPLTKVTLNIYASDVEELRVRYGQGWSTMVRDWIRQKLQHNTPPLRLEDYADHE